MGGPFREAPPSALIQQHGLALALRGRCPFCAEVTSSPGVLRSEPCDVCGGVFPNQKFGETVQAELAALTKERFWIVLGMALLVSVIVTPLPMLSLLPQIGALIAFRFWVANPCLSLTSGKRRFVARWTLRLTTTWLLALGSLALFMPCAASVETVLLITLLWQVGRIYCLWQVGREREGTPVGSGEWLLLFASLFVMLFGVFVALAVVDLVYDIYTSMMDTCMSA